MSRHQARPSALSAPRSGSLLSGLGTPRALWSPQVTAWDAKLCNSSYSICGFGPHSSRGTQSTGDRHNPSLRLSPHFLLVLPPRSLSPNFSPLFKMSLIYEKNQSYICTRRHDKDAALLVISKKRGGQEIQILITIYTI